MATAWVGYEVTACCQSGPPVRRRVLHDGGVSSVYAIVETGGKQFKVSEGATIIVEKLDVVPGDTVTLDKVFLVEKDGHVQVGAPHIAGASVVASVVEHGKAKKIIVFKYKAKKNYRRKQGHRQPFTKLHIDAIRG